MLGSSRVAAHLAASQEGLSSRDLVAMFVRFTAALPVFSVRGYCRIVGRSMNDELERTLQEVVVA
jgi:hypothetical protein